MSKETILNLLAYLTFQFLSVFCLVILMHLIYAFFTSHFGLIDFFTDL